MRKSVIIATLFLFAFLTSGIAQRNDQRAGNESRRSERNEFNRNNGKNDCKKMKKGHMRKMRKMAAVDGRVTPGEKKLLRRERKRVY
jgi:hypothetical protein